MVFMVSIGAMLPANTTNLDNNSTSNVVSSSYSAIGNANQPATGNEATLPVPNSGSQTSQSGSNNAVPMSTSSLNSLSTVTMPANPTLTVYSNGANFNVATPDLLPFAEKYRINSTLNGWVYPNGLSPDYVPLNKLFYNHSNLAAGSTINSTSATDFPVSALRFIPGFPVKVILNASTKQVGVAAYNTTNYLVNSSTNTAYQKSITFIPTSEQIYSVLVTELTGTAPADFNLTIQQFVTPKFFNLFVGDQGSQTGGFNWFFNSSVASFGLLTPPTLDLDTLTYNRSDTGYLDYNYTDFTGYGYNTVIDNYSWASNVYSFFYLNSTSSCNDAKAPENRCQSFLPMFFYDSASSYLLDTGLWVPSLEENHVFGANPQVLNLMGYFGQTGIQGVTKVVVQNAKGTTVLDLSNQFTKTNATSFVEKLSILLPTTTLINGSYTLKIYNNALELYSYPFKVLDSLYGNYNAPVVKFGYETTRFLSNYNTETNGTIVYADVTDKDTSITKVALSYTTDNVTWSTPTNMTWLDVNKYGFVIPLDISNVVNVSLTIYESAPSDQGNMRLQVQSQFLPDVIDLSVNTSTTMQVTFIPRGGSTTSYTLLKFLNDNTYQLSGLSGAQVTNSAGYYVYNITSTVVQNTKFVANFNITPKNAGILTVNTTAVGELGTLQESQNVYLNVLGLTTPTLEMSFVTQSNGKLKDLYPYLNSTYPVTVKYRFIGGTPSTNYNLAVSGSGGSLTTANLPINTQGIYPLVYYQATVSPVVTKTFTGANTIITANMTYGSTSVPITSTINSYKPSLTTVLDDSYGILLTKVYDKLINNLSVVLSFTFINGTPQNSLSYQIKSIFGYFDIYSATVNLSEINGNSYNISITLNRHATSIASDDIQIDVNWDGNSYQKVQHIGLVPDLGYSELLTTQITSGILDVAGTSYKVEGKISSIINIPIRNVKLSLNQSYGLGVTPNVVDYAALNSGGSISFSFTLNYNSTSNINTSPLNFILVFDAPGYLPYKYSFSIQTNSQNNQNSSNTSTTSTPPRTTFGFEFVSLISVLVIFYEFKRKNKKI